MTTDVRNKILSTVAAAAILSGGAFVWNWTTTNLVFAGDLEDLAAMIASELRAEIAPLADELRKTNELATQNAEDIKLGRIESTRSSIRELVANVRTLEARDTQNSSDRLLLAAWREDIEALQRQLNELEGVE